MISYDKGEINKSKDKNASKLKENTSGKNEIGIKYIGKLQANKLLQNIFTLTSITSTIYHQYHHCPLHLGDIHLTN